MLDKMVGLVNEKAEEMTQETIKQFLYDTPTGFVDDELKEIVLERANSQLMFHLGNMHIRPEIDIKEQFDKWYDEEQRDNLKQACARCIKEETDKRQKTGKTNLTILEKYLLEHGISIDESAVK